MNDQFQSKANGTDEQGIQPGMSSEGSKSKVSGKKKIVFLEDSTPDAQNVQLKVVEEELKVPSENSERPKSPQPRSDLLPKTGDNSQKKDRKELITNKFDLSFFANPTNETGYSISRSNFRYNPLDPSSNSVNKKYQVFRANGTLVYEGFLDQKYQKVGMGRLYHPNGDIYEGQFLNDKRHGEGKLYFKSGRAHEFAGGWYEGEFFNDCMEGIGSLHDKNGLEIYTGAFKNNLKDGKGKILLNGDDWYRGDFSNDYRHGFGTLYLKNSFALEGNWEYNHKHGEFKRYPEWKFDEGNIPQVIGTNYETIFFKQDVISFKKSTKAKIQIILSDGSKKDVEILQTSSKRPIKEIANSFGVRITTRDMETLEGSNLIGANIMNFYMRVIEEKYLEMIFSHSCSPEIPKILFLDSDFFSDLTSNNFDLPEINYKQVEHRFKSYSNGQNLPNSQHTIFDEFDRILMIINKGGQHWLLAEIYCKHKEGKTSSITFQIYDSMKGEHQGDNPREFSITNHLVKFAMAEIKAKCKKSEEYKHLEGLINAAKLKFMDVPQQKDLYSCGVFVCQYLQHLAAGQTEIRFTNRSISLFRERIKRTIFGSYEDPLILNISDPEKQEKQEEQERKERQEKTQEKPERQPSKVVILES